MEIPLKTAIQGVTIDYFKNDDIPVLVDRMNDPVVYANTLSIPNPYHKEDAIKYLDSVSRFKEEAGFFKDFAIRLDGVLIGGIGLLYNHGLETHKSEFGYYMSSGYRGRGIMTACINAFVDFVFETRPIDRIEAHVFAHNPASARVLEKCGFEREGFLKNAFLKEHKLLSAYLYAKCREAD